MTTRTHTHILTHTNYTTHSHISQGLDLEPDINGLTKVVSTSPYLLALHALLSGVVAAKLSTIKKLSSFIYHHLDDADGALLAALQGRGCAAGPGARQEIVSLTCCNGYGLLSRLACNFLAQCAGSVTCQCLTRVPAYVR